MKIDQHIKKIHKIKLYANKLVHQFKHICRQRWFYVLFGSFKTARFGAKSIYRTFYSFGVFFSEELSRSRPICQPSIKMRTHWALHYALYVCLFCFLFTIQTLICHFMMCLTNVCTSIQLGMLMGRGLINGRRFVSSMYVISLDQTSSLTSLAYWQSGQTDSSTNPMAHSAPQRCSAVLVYMPLNRIESFVCESKSINWLINWLYSSA